MFDMQKITDTFKWPIQVDVPTKNGGFERWSFGGEFKQVSVEQLKESAASDKEVCELVLVGWDHTLKNGDQPLEYNEENRAKIIAYIPAAAGISKAFYEAMNGDKARRKN